MIDRPSVRELVRLKRNMLRFQRGQAIAWGMILGLFLIKVGAYTAGDHTLAPHLVTGAVLLLAYALLLAGEIHTRRQIAGLR